MRCAKHALTLAVLMALSAGASTSMAAEPAAASPTLGEVSDMDAELARLKKRLEIVKTQGQIAKEEKEYEKQSQALKALRKQDEPEVTVSQPTLPPPMPTAPSVTPNFGGSAPAVPSFAGGDPFAGGVGGGVDGGTVSLPSIKTISGAPGKLKARLGFDDGGVLVVRQGDRLPDGSEVRKISAEQVLVRGLDGLDKPLKFASGAPAAALPPIPIASPTLDSTGLNPPN